MPRKSAASLSVIPIDGRSSSRLRPPATSLSGAERTAFVDLVSACKPGHFQASDLPLPMNNPRALNAHNSPKGFTRFCSGIARLDVSQLRVRRSYCRGASLFVSNTASMGPSGKTLLE
jgi:hypothetical protein